jgi:hypothetical protein
MPLTDAPDVCQVCFADVTVEEIVAHPTIPYAYLDLCHHRSIGPSCRRRQGPPPSGIDQM